MTITTQPGGKYKMTNGDKIYDELNPIDLIGLVKYYINDNTDGVMVLDIEQIEPLELKNLE